MKIIEYPQRSLWKDLSARPEKSMETVRLRVAEILDRVAEGGDKSLKELTKELDGVILDSLFVTKEEIDSSSQFVDENLKKSIDIAASNIEKFHSAQTPRDIEVETMSGIKCLQKSFPIKRVGLYIPGGTAPLFSTVLMLAIPARIAGCAEVALFTPPGKDGKIDASILYVASKFGIKEIIKVGGAQAIAAMAYGTESIRKVDKIYGPGNSYVAQAKLQVSGSVAIDMVAGPSELMIIADKTAKPTFLAADLLSQAEHGPDSQLFLLTTEREIGIDVNRELSEQIKRLSREKIAHSALENSSIVILKNEEEMVDFANLYGAEHLMVSTNNPWRAANRIINAGSIFIGNYSPESAGDYASGTNHSLPTNGWTKSFGGISVDSFMHKISFQQITKEGLQLLGGTIEAMAEAEGLLAHKNAVSIRLKEIENGVE
ncbi:MAG: histidinol dehydrogenase [Bacteroidales bacterium]|nr:histidinol dehydrogenase [Bacteroidales bacterium]